MDEERRADLVVAPGRWQQLERGGEIGRVARDLLTSGHVAGTERLRVPAERGAVVGGAVGRRVLRDDGGGALAIGEEERPAADHRRGGHGGDGDGGTHVS